MTIHWKFKREYHSWYFKTPIFNPRQGLGDYEIWIAPRPAYCDRGDWLIYVDCHNGDLDGADGFPRYFFGTADEAKAQMETWLSRRKAYQNYVQRNPKMQ